MNIALQGTGYKSFVFGFNDVKAKEDIQALYENSDKGLKFKHKFKALKMYNC
ncbi:hypothetical protein V7P22_001154 [Campylobacter coli]|nr:hypothetical protein [Campylobacter coli]